MVMFYSFLMYLSFIQYQSNMFIELGTTIENERR